MTTARPAAVVVLAAGQGTRMRSATSKMLHAIGGRTVLGHVLAASQGLDPERLVVVVRHAREEVAAEAVACVPSVVIADQDDVPGTGRAVQCALERLDAAAHAVAASAGTASAGDEVGLEGTVVVVAGDVPLIDPETLAELHAQHVAGGHAATVLTAVVPDATGYGRIVRDEHGRVAGIVEHRDATHEQLGIREINSSIYVFDAAVLRGALGRLGQDNAQGEVYLTDVLAIARADGGVVGAVQAASALTVEGVNDRAQLAQLGAELNRRTLTRHMLAGVTIVDPGTTWIDVDVELAQDVTILPGTQLHGATTIGTGSTIGPDTTLTDVEVGEGVTVVRTHGSLAVLGDGASVGPFAYLRPGTHLGAHGKIGTFVETKNVEIGEGSKVPHLTYVGDATIGEGTNIGAGSIFVNYDGVRKHRTSVGSHARTGANNKFVAPVSIGDGAYTGAGAVILEDVPAGALAVSNAPQRTIDGWVERRRPGTDSARAAARAASTAVPQGLGAQARAERERAESATPTLPGQSAPGDAVPEGDSAR
ncbi:bifunctional UDP-N-acetylglucosamine diphosphorylase/glucosamine-1-phosphate N-acetyltransferase GlmU [Sanguibacter massiliensis]|uniref:bifunctional UDP-N-acetylglucosamine diphosphorylase/glucosamine-1-phosphate N-acetyltransferase GlmU n=1 Tax=Sanguibacter massiliensis TaxID=1973217 RepID=UPI000C81C885|nr:bifunctional UDP-N-acetylglucosamine diphosphorylase/glucosamine-1-phosphate N-acetyltransferase GlmU [Sanguibacter massiliensis]